MKTAKARLLYRALLALALALVLPAASQAHRVKSISLHINDTQAAACQNVTARVTFCIQVQKEDIVDGKGKAKVKVRLVYDEWGDDTDYEGSDGDFAAVCEKEFTVDFLPQNVGADICRENQYLCQFHASTYDVGWTTDPDFYACAKSTHNGAPNKYSGQVEVEFDDQQGLQPATASLIPPGGPSAVAVTAAADFPAAAAGLTVTFDPRTTAVVSVEPSPAFEATEIEPGVWSLTLTGPATFPAHEPLVTFLAEVDGDLLYGDQRHRGGVGVLLSEVEFYDVDGAPLDTTELLSFGYDQDFDGLPVPLEGDIDADGVHDDFDAFPLNPAEISDKDEDALGDAFEQRYWGGLAALPDDDDDGDGLVNLDEFVQGTDPTHPDTDGDGVEDGADAFPADPKFAADSDGDLVADPVDLFPEIPYAALDDDWDGLGDAWERYWFGSLAEANPDDDFDGDGASNLEEFLAGTNPVTVPKAPVFTGGGEDPGGARADALLYPLTVNEQGPLRSADIVLEGNASSTVTVEFGYAEDADLSTLEASWNGVSLAGPDGVRQSGDEPFRGVVFDVAPLGFEIRFSGLPLSDDVSGDRLQLQIASASDATLVDVDVLHFYQTPTCTFPESELIGGLNGYCSSAGADGDEYHLFFEDFSGAEVLSFDWPGDLDDPPAADCPSLCQAGALQVAYTTDRLNLQRPDTEPLPTFPLDKALRQAAGGCPLTPNADVEYDNCGGGGQFRCFLACGKGCVGCEVKVGGECGNANQSCKLHDFKCYKRPCCVTHDICLALATNWRQELACHLQAFANGCDMTDARGQSYNLNDATCFNPKQQCLEVPPPGEPTEACCMEGPIGFDCQDLTAADCYAAGGMPQGAGTSCNGPDGVPDSGDEPCESGYSVDKPF